MKRAAALCLICGILVYSPLHAFSDAAPCYFNDEEKHIYACAENAGRRIALTFDDGPHPVYTDQILKILGEYNARATFFVVGENVALYPEVFAREISAGHAVGGHTFSHAHIKKISEAQLRAEMKKTAEMLDRFGVRTQLFRPPEGVCDRKVLSIAQECGVKIILWAVDTCDWRCPSVGQITDAVIGKVGGGEIVLMHDYVSGKSRTPEALERILEALSAEGFEFVTVNELLGF